LVVLAKLFSGEPTVRRRTPVRERVGILAACSVFVRARSTTPRGSKFWGEAAAAIAICHIFISNACTVQYSIDTEPYRY
jgi:hypothetical protein